MGVQLIHLPDVSRLCIKRWQKLFKMSVNMLRVKSLGGFLISCIRLNNVTSATMVSFFSVSKVLFLLPTEICSQAVTCCSAQVPVYNQPSGNQGGAVRSPSSSTNSHWKSLMVLNVIVISKTKLATGLLISLLNDLWHVHSQFHRDHNTEWV